MGKIDTKQKLGEYIFQMMYERDCRFVAEAIKEWDTLGGVVPPFPVWINNYVRAKELAEGAKN